MTPQGSSIVNTTQYDSMKKRVESVTSCEQLNSVGTEILDSLKAETDAITEQLEKSMPLLALLDPPTTPTAVIEWIQGLIDSLITPLAKPAITYQAQIPIRAAAIADLVSTINKKASEFQECTLTFPTP